MRHMHILSLLCVLSFAAADMSAQSPGKQLAVLLPRGTASVDVLELWAPPRLTELSQRLQRAAQADPDWFQQQVRRAPPGQPLPYDPKLGLTESEYHEFLTLTEDMEMRPVRTATVVLEPTAVGWRFGSGTTVAGLRGVEIDTVKNEVQTSFGRLPTVAPIVPGPAQRATGPWGGPQWKLESVDEATITGTVAAFAVGKHKATGRTIIYFDAKRAENGQISARESLFLRLIQ